MNSDNVNRFGYAANCSTSFGANSLIGSLSLIGFPFLTGFYSKDLILEISFASFSETGHFAYWLGTVGAFFTAFYSTRLLFFAFLISFSQSLITLYLIKSLSKKP